MYNNFEGDNTHLNKFTLKSDIYCDLNSNNACSGDKVMELKNILYNCNNLDLNNLNNSKVFINNDIEKNNNELLLLIDNIKNISEELYCCRNIEHHQSNISFEDKICLSQRDYLNIKKSKLINNLYFYMRVYCNKKTYINFISHYFNIIYTNNINLLFQYECILQKFEEYNTKLTEEDYYNAYISLNKIPLFVSEHNIDHSASSNVKTTLNHIRSNNNFEPSTNFLNIYDKLTVNFFNHIFNQIDSENNMNNQNYDNSINNFIYKKNLLKGNIFNLLLNISKSCEIKYIENASDRKFDECYKDDNEKSIFEIIKNKIDNELSSLNKVKPVAHDFINNNINGNNNYINNISNESNSDNNNDNNYNENNNGNNYINSNIMNSNYVNNKNDNINNESIHSKDEEEMHINDHDQDFNIIKCKEFDIVDNYGDNNTTNGTTTTYINGINSIVTNNENNFLELIKEKLNKEIEIYNNYTNNKEELNNKKDMNTVDNIYKLLKSNVFIPNNNIYTDFVEKGNDIFLNKIKKNDKNAYFRIIEKFDRMYNIINEFKINVKRARASNGNLYNEKEDLHKNKKKKNSFNEDEVYINNQKKRCLRNSHGKKIKIKKT